MFEFGHRNVIMVITLEFSFAATEHFTKLNYPPDNNIHVFSKSRKTHVVTFLLHPDQHFINKVLVF